jgi:hypothetical protein
MRIHNLILAFFFTLLFLAAKAESSQVKNDSTVTNKENNRVNACFTFNTLAPLSFAIEIKTSPFTGVYFSPRVASITLDEKTTIYSFTSEYRFYINNKKDLSGFYVGPYLKFRHRIDSDRDEWDEPENFRATANFFGGGITGGYQKVFDHGFVLNVFTGYGYTPVLNRQVLIGSAKYWNSLNEYDFRIGFAIGAAF